MVACKLKFSFTQSRFGWSLLLCRIPGYKKSAGFRTADFYYWGLL